MSIVQPGLECPIRPTTLSPPRLGDRLVSRARLLDRLEAGRHVPLTLVSAPAGFGKTTLLAQWVVTHAVPAAWVRTEADDREITHFSSHLLAALAMVVPDVVHPPIREPHGSNRVPAAAGLALGDALARLSHDVIIIIDDYHLAASIAVEHFLTSFLRAAPPAVHLVLATRSDPAMSLARRRLQGMLVEVRAADLRFTDEETAALLAAFGHSEVDLARIAALQRQTEGWIVGLRLALLAHGGATRLSKTTPRAEAGDRHLMDFLLEEVLSQQSVETQDVLMRLAIVDRLCPLLVANLLDGLPEDPRETLERLRQAGLFLEADADEVWWRIHPLFRRLLRHQLERRLAPQVATELHARASTWFADHALLDEAIHHRAASGDLVATARLITDHIDATLAQEDWTTLDGWLRLLPERLISRSPELLLARAWIAQLSGRMLPSRAIVDAVEALLAAADDPKASALQCECDVLAQITSWPTCHDAHDLLARAKQALASLPSERRFPFGQAVFVLGCSLHALGRTEEAIRWLTDVAGLEEERIDAGSMQALLGLVFVHRQAGHLDACAAVTRQTLNLAEREGLAVSRGWALWALGWVAYERDALDEATAHFSAITRDHRRVHLSCACEALMGLALIAHARGDADGADAALRELQEWILAANALEYLPWQRAFAAHLALLRDQTERAIGWQRGERAMIDDCALDLTAHPFLVQIQALVANGTTESLLQAERDLAALRTAAASRHHTTTLIKCGLLDALVHEARGDRTAALTAMAEAQALGRPGGFRRTFLDVGGGRAPLLAAQGGARASASPAWSAPTPAGPSPAMLDVLTIREAQILEALTRRLSYREIADELFISLETVKSHTSSIYRKLDVADRRAALAKAHALGWTAEDSPP